MKATMLEGTLNVPGPVVDLGQRSLTVAVELTFATNGLGSRESALSMTYKLIEAAKGKWRMLNGALRVPPSLD